MKEIILTTSIPREKGWIYFTGTDDKGNINVGKSRTSWNKEDKKKD